MGGTLRITGDATADDLLRTEPLALVVGMLLDQQVPMEWAFRGPATLRARLGHLDCRRIAAMDEERLVEISCEPPAIHRFPAVMARRIHGICVRVVEEYDGTVERLWEGQPEETYRRLRELPGYGDEKARILIAILAKRYGVTPEGWERVCAPFGDSQPRTAADVDGPETLAAVKAWKAHQRSVGRSKQD
jgi:uncharacterized HhH-GPD family protein